MKTNIKKIELFILKINFYLKYKKMEQDDYIIYFKTKYIDMFKTIFDIIQKLKTDSFIRFYKNTPDHPGYIEIKDTDTDQVILFKLIIPHNNLDEYYCSEPTYTIGVDFSILSKIIQIMSDNTELCFYISKYEEQKLNIISYNATHTQEISSTINLSINNYIEIPGYNINYASSIKINAELFHTACKKHTKIGQYIKIKCTKNYLELATQDTDTTRAELVTKFHTSTNTLIKNNVCILYDKNYLNNNDIPTIEAIYSLTNIAHFDKLKSKSSDIDIRMAPDNKPIGLIYNIPQFGQFIVFISAIMQDI